MEHTKLNNQRGLTVLLLIISIALGLFLTMSITYMFTNMLTEDMQQTRFNNFLADKDSFYLELEESLTRADSVEVTSGQIDVEEEGIFTGTKDYTTITAVKIYNDGTSQLQDMYQATDSGKSLTTTKQTFKVGSGGSLTLVSKSSTKYSTINDLYAVKAEEVCYSKSDGSIACEPVSNLLDLIVYSEGIGGKSPELNSRRLMYYAER